MVNGYPSISSIFSPNFETLGAVVFALKNPVFKTIMLDVLEYTVMSMLHIILNAHKDY